MKRPTIVIIETLLLALAAIPALVQANLRGVHGANSGDSGRRA
jgi:hypothetical protein